MRLSGKKLILLLLSQPGGNEAHTSLSGRTRLIKMAFLFEKEVWPEFKKDRPSDEYAQPEFFAWKYGPFSSDILNDLEFLINRKYVSSQHSGQALSQDLEEYRYWLEDSCPDDVVSEYEGEEFSLTDIGAKKAVTLWDELTDNQKTIMLEFVRVLVKAPLTRILEYVYKKYEKGYTEKSLIRDRFLQ